MADLANIPHVIIVGGGFGGLQTAQALAKAAVSVTLIDRNNHHLFQPLLYQVATAGMSADEIAVPIRAILRRQKNCRVLMGTVDGIDLDARTVSLADGASLTFDYLVIAAGARTNYFGHGDWATHTLGLKSVEEAAEVKRQVLLAFEQAEREPNAAKRREMLTFVVIGGGPTGVELSGALAELARGVLAGDYRSITPDDVRVILLEAAPRLLLPFHEKLSANARRQLERLGVQVRLGSGVTAIGPGYVQLGDERINSAMTCWTAGVMPQLISRNVTGLTPTDRGFIPVGQDCSVPGHANVFAIGDIASFTPTGQKRPLPGVAPVAMQQARYVGRAIAATLKNRPRKPFVYLDKGNMATIGKNSAVLEFKKLRMTGFLAWMAWIVVHLYYLVGFRSRALVAFEWFWAYVANRRGARILTQLTPPPKVSPTSADTARAEVAAGAGAGGKSAWNNNVDPQRAGA